MEKRMYKIQMNFSFTLSKKRMYVYVHRIGYESRNDMTYDYCSEKIFLIINQKNVEPGTLYDDFYLQWTSTSTDWGLLDPRLFEAIQV